MDYEKKYKEALERAREYWETDNDNTLDIKAKGTMEYLFPELAGSKDERIRKWLIGYFHQYKEDGMEKYANGLKVESIIAWLEKQGKQKSQRMISAEAKEAMYDKPANTVEQKCEESKTKVFDAPTPFEDKLYAFVLACEILVDPSKREFILEHSQEILDAAKEQIGKEQSSTWSKEDEEMLVDAYVMLDWYKGNNWWTARHIKDWLKSLKERIGGLTDFDVIGEVVQRNLLEEVVKQMSDTLLIETLLYRKKQGTLSIFYGERKEGLERFLKSICTWKPSDEQIKALDFAIDCTVYPEFNIQRSVLKELLEQLKKLREE